MLFYTLGLILTLWFLLDGGEETWVPEEGGPAVPADVVVFWDQGHPGHDPSQRTQLRWAQKQQKQQKQQCTLSDWCMLKTSQISVSKPDSQTMCKK